MLLWQVTLAAFIVTSIFGLYLFSGYTFRIKVYYPLVLVTCHVAAAIATTILFGILIVRLLFSYNQVHVFSVVFSVISFVLVLLTLASGLYFYFRYEARRRRTKWGLIGFHLAMAGLSFIFAISSISTVAAPKPTHTYPGTAWYKYYLRHPN
ncbi:hypothetical protein [Alicyclobacillus mengziensis]|uniref:Uncharacterized protein n=1 Tax=Alicyclobacillus mengziensis TaxID=2931921 RepID=A0A9X7VXJ2_9BACL|nr:hypothetical protein [Alicyclobacillus mengziensis]QSO46869.1 hypothetical protein JZ786_20935 [Alicyclobacillus mengziensis]